MNIYLTRKHSGYKVQCGKREPLIDGVCQVDGYRLGSGTHDDTCKGHKYKHKNEVCLRNCEVRGRESLGDTVTGQDARDKDKLRDDELVVVCTLEGDRAYVRQSPYKQDLKCLILSTVRSTRAEPGPTYICPYTGIVILCRFLLLHKVPRGTPLNRLPGLQVDDGFLVHLICVYQHLNIDLRVAVLNDSAEVRLNCVVLFGSPRDL
jgi:hypothetical protein